MGNFKYTYNVEEFDRFFNTRLLPMLKSVSDKRFLLFPWVKKTMAKEAFDVVCSILGRFTSYEEKHTQNFDNLLRDLRIFPDFFSVKYNACFTGNSSGRDFDAKSIELYKSDGRKNKLVWNGVLISVPFHQKTYGKIFFKKRNTAFDNNDAIKVIFNNKNYEDISEKSVLKKGETYLDIVAQNYFITFTNKQDQQNFSNEEFCKKICTVIKKYNCNISFTILNNHLFIAISGIENHSSYSENGWFDFNCDFTDEDFMKDVFQQFETVVMTLKLLNS